MVEHHDVQILCQERSIRRWLNRLGTEAFFQLLEVKRADNMGQNYELVKGRLALLDEIKAKAEEIILQKQCVSLKDLAVNGLDVTAAGVSQGPAVGRVLNVLLEKVLSGEFPNERESLLSLIPAIAQNF